MHRKVGHLPCFPANGNTRTCWQALCVHLPFLAAATAESNSLSTRFAAFPDLPTRKRTPFPVNLKNFNQKVDTANGMLHSTQSPTAESRAKVGRCGGKWPILKICRSILHLPLLHLVSAQVDHQTAQSRLATGLRRPDLFISRQRN